MHRSFRNLCTMASFMPYFTEGEVVKGFGRGSKELGIPTANFPDAVVEHLPSDAPCGVYYGWASVDHGPVHRMVMSIGWNPYYKNTKKTMETHIVHSFPSDFYGANLKVVMLGYIRPMRNYTSLEELVEAIRKDIADANMLLDQPQSQAFKTNNFFTATTNGHAS